MTLKHNRALDIALGNYTVYKHTSPSGKVYIGITRDKLQHRWKGGHGYVNNQHFARAIQKYGWPAFQHEVIAEGLTQQEAETLEIKLIAQYDSTNPLKGYNRAPGGHTQSPETRAKISRALTGVPLSKAHRARLSKAFKGRQLSESCKQKISENHKNNPKVIDHIVGLNHARAGVPKTEEHRRKISASQPRRRQIINLDTGEIYGCIQDAAQAVKGNHPNIVKACTGERQTAYGYHWEYITAEEVAP